jgi:hypothetical protein
MIEECQMLKASKKTKTGQTVVLGLSHENIRRLQKGKPIYVELDELGIQGASIIIFSAKDEYTMANMLKDRVGPDTKIIDKMWQWP